MKKNEYLDLCSTYCTINKFSSNDNKVVLQSIKDMYDDLLQKGYSDDDILTALGEPKDLVHSFYSKYEQLKQDNTKIDTTKTNQGNNKSYEKQYIPKKNPFFEIFRILILLFIATTFVLPIFVSLFIAICSLMILCFVGIFTPVILFLNDYMIQSYFYFIPIDQIPDIVYFTISIISIIGLFILILFNKLLFKITKKFFRLF